MNCTGNCKGIMPKVTPELIKASKMVNEYYRDFCNELGCEPDPQCFIEWFNNVLLSKEFYKETQKNKWLKETLEICQKENVELRNTIKHLLDYIKEENK